MSDLIYQELLDSLRQGRSCVLVTVAAVSGSVPREPGAKMLVHDDGKIEGTVGGGKFEALVIEEALKAIPLPLGRSFLKTYPLHEGSEESFGAICGGEVTVLIEPQPRLPFFLIVGAGHCAKALARIAGECGFRIIVADDRTELLGPPHYASHVQCVADPAPEFIRSQAWSPRDALVLVSRNYHLDREALAAALETGGIGYIGMIGSRRKVRNVFDELKTRGFSQASLDDVRAPIGLDIGADSPEEIAISILAEVFTVLHGTTGRPLAACRT